jgi:periplasmic protein TonB
MDRHFILPATLAAALHAGVLFGYRPAHIKGPGPVREPAAPVIPLVIYEEIESRIFETTPDTPRPKGSTLQPADPEIVGPIDRDAIPVPIVNLPKIPVDRPNSREPIGIQDGMDNIGPMIFLPASLDNEPRIRSQVAPQFPYDAKRRGQPGEVLVNFMVDEAGRVLEPRIVRSSDPVFDEPTLRAVSKWRFEPGRVRGELVRFRMSVPVVFSMTDR